MEAVPSQRASAELERGAGLEPTANERDKVEALPEEARPMFGEGLGLARRYAELLVGKGRLVGVLGPREGARIWSRHLINSGALAQLIPEGARVADVGSGAGLPGIPLAIARPDLTVRLVDSLARRVRFLQETVTELGLQDRAEVVHSRAEALPADFCDVVTARAVADLPTLLTWCLPLLPHQTGFLLAARGEAAAEELKAASPMLKRMRAIGELIELPAMTSGPPVRVVKVARR